MHPWLHFMAMAKRWALRTFYCHIVIIIIVIVLVVVVGVVWLDFDFDFLCKINIKLTVQARDSAHNTTKKGNVTEI